MAEHEYTPVIEETDMKLSSPCAGCGAEENIKLFAFKTNVYNQNNRYVLPYCQRCTLLIMRTFIQAWQPDITALDSPTLYNIEKHL